jgi:hypothetical protein
MEAVPGKVLGEGMSESLEPSSRLLDQGQSLGRIVAGEKTETLFISSLQRVACTFVQDVFRSNLPTATST